MDCREKLINKTMLMLDEAGVNDIDKIKNVLVLALSDYEVTDRCTDIVVIDDSNTQLVKLFLATKKVEGGSTETAKHRWYVLNNFFSCIGKNVKDITSFDILSWLAYKQQTLALSTVEGYRTVINSFYSWLKTNGLIDRNPMETIKPIKHPDPLHSSFTSVEIDSLKTACKTNLERAVVELLLSSGIRCAELCALKWQDINFTTKDITVIEGKGNKNRVTMMDDVAKKYLQEYRSGLKEESEYVFATKFKGVLKQRSTDSIALMLNNLAKRAGVETANPHKFRRTFATTLYKRGLDVRMIQKLLGHSNINTTMIYIDSDIDMLRDAYKKCA